MKFWIWTLIAVPLIFVACGDKNGNNSPQQPQQIATVPPPTNCIDGTTYCNSNMYAQYNGFAAYPYNPYYYNTSYSWSHFYGAGNGGYYGNFCNCPTDHRPVYNGQYGLGCMALNQFQPYAYGALYWGWGANNNQWVNIPQVSNTQGYPVGAQNGCYQNVAQTCFVDQPNACGMGAICQPTGGGARLGLCVSGNPGQLPGGTVGGYR